MTRQPGKVTALERAKTPFQLRSYTPWHARRRSVPIPLRDVTLRPNRASRRAGAVSCVVRAGR